MSAVVGIDLGTTYSAVAVVEDGRPRILGNREGDPITPSVVLFQGDEPLVGEMAKRSAATAPLDVVQFVKRHIGDPAWRFTTSSGTDHVAEQISAIILKRLRSDAELALGEPVADAVITVPAYFEDRHRTATIDAGRIAGLDVRRIINEPTAAALAFGVETDATGTFLVYDLGGGTFDVTVLRAQPGEFETVASLGDRNLGGFDWDNELVLWCAEQFRAQGAPDLLDDVRAAADLREKTEVAKRALTNVERTKLFVSHDGFSGSVEVTRERFDDLTRGLLGRTRDLTQDVLDDAGLDWPAIDRLLLVGGSTRMPQVRALVEQLSGRTAERNLHPDHAVALGAAVQGALLDDASGSSRAPAVRHAGRLVTVRDATSHGFGIVTTDQATHEQYNAVVVPPHSPIPAQHAQRFATLHDQQTELQIQVTQGTERDLAYASIVGASEIEIPPYPANAPIEIRISCDVDGVLHVEVVDLTTNRPLGEFEIDRPSNLDGGAIDRMRNDLDDLGDL